SIKVSYPNPQDLRRARARHWDAGGSIMIHGLPNQPKHDPDCYLQHDWTDGCIALSHGDMVEIWMLTPDDVPIDLLPCAVSSDLSEFVDALVVPRGRLE